MKSKKRYAGLFKSHKGNPAKPLRLAPIACMIQAELVIKLMMTVKRRLIRQAWWTIVQPVPFLSFFPFFYHFLEYGQSVMTV